MSLTRKELIKEMSKVARVPMRDIDPIMDAFVEVVSQKMAEGESIQIPGFCVFTTKVREEQERFNPVKQEVITWPRKVVPVIRPLKQLKKIVNGEVDE